MPPSKMHIYSFHIGAVNLAKQAGLSDIHIQMLERWKSQVYLQYIGILRSQLAMLSKQLVRGHTAQQLDYQHAHMYLTHTAVSSTGYANNISNHAWVERCITSFCGLWHL